MKLSKDWTNDERLVVIAAAAAVIAAHIAKGGTYGTAGFPNMEAIRIVTLCPAQELESTRQHIEMLVKASRVQLPAGIADAFERLLAIRDCATLARDYFMAGAAYGSPGIPTMDTILALAIGPSLPHCCETFRAQIESYRKRTRTDLRSGREAYDAAVIRGEDPE